MKVSANFDGGNIIFESITQKSNSTTVKLKIRNDNDAVFLQWFYFKITEVKAQNIEINLTNAGEAFSPAGWKGYQACASYDRINWFRCDTEYQEDNLKIKVLPKYDSMYFAYFPPYTYEQHLDLIARSQLSTGCQHTILGETVQHRDIDFLTIGTPSVFKKKIWVIARQHAGESMASWFMEGLIQRLLDPNDPVAIKLLRKSVFYLVPHMNIDGSFLGNIRVNAAGRDLNREWANPSRVNSPEVFFVRKKMEEIGVDLAFDIHGDEELPYNFVSRIDGIPGFDERLSKQQHSFIAAWKQISPDFQDEYGYPVDAPGKANLSICSKNLAHSFNCLALTVEMPFKDNANLPNPDSGWSIERSKKLGASLPAALLLIADDTNRL